MRRKRIRSRRVTGLVVVIVAIAAALNFHLPASSSSPSAAPSLTHVTAHRGALGEAGGAAPDGTTVFDVDIGPVNAAAWRSRHGAEQGLCQIYGNEPWHYELRPEAGADGCPPMYADPTHDPRMQK